MGFNVEKFDTTKFKLREETLTLPALKAYFEEGEAPEFTVRGLSASELSRAEDAKAQARTVGIILEALTKPGARAENVSQMRKALGLSDDETPGDLKKRIEMLVMGSVNPKLTLATVVKLTETFPIEFYQLTHAITKLTGQGAEIEGKSKPSGPKVTSEA